MAAFTFVSNCLVAGTALQD